MKKLPLSAPTPSRTFLPYGRVVFLVRARLGLSVTQHLLLDVVTTLSKRTGSCYASQAYLANLLGVSKRTLQRTVGRLRRRGLLESDRARRRLRTTGRWQGAIASAAERQLVARREDKLSPEYKER